MLPTHQTQTTFVPLHPAERCVEFPLLLLDEQLAELEQNAKSAQRTIAGRSSAGRSASTSPIKVLSLRCRWHVG